jgi:glucose-1-phosphate adenylyltransferase
MGIIFANDVAIDALTEKRTMASLPFGGRYRQVDFHLSNLAAAGIRHVGIVSRSNYQSLMNHVGSGEEWGLELEEGGLEFLTPYALGKADSYRGKLENLYAVLDFLKFSEDEYVVLTDSSILTNLDVKDIVKQHKNSGKDITIVVKPGVANNQKVLDLALKAENGEISDIVVSYPAAEGYLASMDLFVVGRQWLIEKVQALVAHDKYHMDRDLVLGLWNAGQLSINVYEYNGVALYNESTEEYFANSMALLKKEVREGLFGGHHAIFTKVRDRVPTYYGDCCEVENCMIADGCQLEGEVEDSVLFRNVTICKGAEVENCVIMNDTVVGEGAKLEYVILDKNVTVSPNAKLVGTAKNPIIIKRGETV